MDFLISDTFTDSLTKLTGDEQKAVKTTAFDLQLNPASPGMSFHKLDRARDKNFWSVRVNNDIRVIVHKTDASLMLCYVDHHDNAYAWAERRKLETHPKTGAAQLVEVRETVQEIVVPRYVDDVQPVIYTNTSKPKLFTHLNQETLLSYGVPLDWVEDVLVADEDSYFALADHLPAEAAEALLEVATGGKPQVPQHVIGNIDPFAHPDALRRFRLMTNVEELTVALEYPWEKWTTFLHPEQRQFVERDYSGPARVSGSAGTGKTIVALHRAVYLARKNPESRVLLTTFSETLANALRIKLKRLISAEPRLGERLEVHAMNAIGERLFELQFGKVVIPSKVQLSELIKEAAALVPECKFGLHFLLGEWDDIADAWQLTTWESYRDVKRIGRKTRLAEPQRQILWSVFSRVIDQVEQRNWFTHARIFNQLALQIAQRKKPPFDYVVVDESQDINIPQLRFLAAMGSFEPNALFFAGDLGQRIFQQPFSWKSLGVDIRGRARTLHINYRTSHQIRKQADQLLAPEIIDVDGNEEQRQGTISVFDGPPPLVKSLDTEIAEIQAVSDWLLDMVNDKKVSFAEIAVIVRSEVEIPRAIAAIESANLPFKVLDDHVETTIGFVSLATMPLVKGLEFKAVVIMACDDEVIPSQQRIENVTDDADLEEVYNTERHLLYVACTRARDYLLISALKPESEFLSDLK